MTAVGSTERLPLFPLHSVLFPGGTVRLRIFERRYLDMIRDCARDGGGFGVCLILEGNEAGEPARPAAIGTCARIVDFSTLPDGLLGIDAMGGRRFHVDALHVRDSGLLIGDVRWLADEEPAVVPAQHGLLASLLRDLLERFGQLPDRIELLDDQAWVGFRLAELLPLSSQQRQQLLEQDHGLPRLDLLAEQLAELKATQDPGT